MIRYVLKRLVMLIPILIAVAIFVFALMEFVPGDPMSILVGENPTPAQIEAANEQYGFNRPFIVRLGEYLYNIFTKLSFGNSYINGVDVGKALIERFPNTLILAVFCILVSTAIGVPLGIFAAMHANKAGDRITLFITILLHSMPQFWLALLLVLLFALQLRWLPATVSGTPTWKNFILPVVANSVGSLANIARQTRSSMLDVIRSDYIYTARSKGVSERTVIWKHALPNALIPVITITGSHFGHLLGGAAVIESIFTIPGIGAYMVNGLKSQDYPVVEGCVVYIAFMFSIIMLLTDLVYAFVDPRIKAKYIRSKRSSREKNKLVTAEG